MTKQRHSLTVDPGTCLAVFTSVRSIETSGAVRVYVRGKGGDNGAKCADGVAVHLAGPLDRRTVLDGSTGKPMRLWR